MTITSPIDPKLASMTLAWSETVQNIPILNGRIQEIYFLSYGGQALIRTGVLDGSTWVTLKTPHLLIKEEYNRKSIQRINRQVCVWSRLCHPNLLPFLGVYLDNSDLAMPSLVSPYQVNGNVMRFMETNPTIGSSIKLKILEQTVDALMYLHKQNIVHGDIKGANILVSDKGDAMLCDFGTSRICEAKGFTTGSLIFSARWAAKEILLYGQAFTYESDIWSFGMTILEVFTGEFPYREILNGFAVLRAIADGRHPLIPTTDAITDEIWDPLIDSWNSEPESRPDLSSVAHMLRRARHQVHL